MGLEIETDRLVLRPIGPQDAEDHIAMMQDPGVAEFLTAEGTPRDRGDEWRMYATILGHQTMRGYCFFSVIEKATGAWVGRVGPWMPEGWPSLECGWAIKREAWGKGYAPEAAIASIRWILDTYPDLPRIISLIDPKNKNSQAVAKKIGEQHDGEIFELWGIKLDVWSADREVWLERFGAK